MSIHRDLPSSEVHEAKQIIDALTTDAGKVITPSATNAGQGELRSLTLADIPTAEAELVELDSINPHGWGYYVDSLTTPTIVVGTTPTKITIDGLGAAGETDYLPRIIRGTDELWDGTNSLLTPIALGDGYIFRVSLEVTAKSGAPTEFAINCDIGGGVSPSVPVFQDIRRVSPLATYTVTFSGNLYSLSTFLTNGMQIFLSTDSGTVTVANRSILVTRLSSGAN